MLVGNKCDMDSERVVSNADGKATATKFNIGFIESSAKTNVNVQEIFFELVRMINKWYVSSAPRSRAIQHSYFHILCNN